MPIYRGSSPIDAIRKGGQAVTAVYRGADKIFPLLPPIVQDGLAQWFYLSSNECWDGTSTTVTDLKGAANGITVGVAPIAINRGSARGMNFDSKTYYLDLLNNAITVPGTSEFSVEIVHRHNSGQLWRFDNRGNSRGFLFAKDQFTIFSIADYSLSASQPSDIIYIETWVASGTNLKRYINGVKVDDINISSSRTLSGSQNYFYGASHGSSGGFSAYYQGELYDLKWYKNKALTAAEVTQNYQAQKALYGLS